MHCSTVPGARRQGERGPRRSARRSEGRAAAVRSAAEAAPAHDEEQARAGGEDVVARATELGEGAEAAAAGRLRSQDEVGGVGLAASAAAPVAAQGVLCTRPEHELGPHLLLVATGRNLPVGRRGVQRRIGGEIVARLAAKQRLPEPLSTAPDAVLAVSRRCSLPPPPPPPQQQPRPGTRQARERDKQGVLLRADDAADSAATAAARGVREESPRR